MVPCRKCGTNGCTSEYSNGMNSQRLTKQNKSEAQDLAITKWAKEK